MRDRLRWTAVLPLLLAAAFPAAAAIPSPEAHLGFPIGADRKLADYDQIIGYFQALARASDRVELLDVGKSSLGRTLWMAVISSPANLAAADRHREIAAKLADPRGLSEAEIEELVAEGKAIVLVTCNIHSTEIGASQMAMEWAYELAATDDPQWESVLDDVILLLFPSINPDGTQMVVEWYREWLGTDHEGGRMPWLYHHYAGHDNNRDWFMLNLPETRAVNRVLYHDWFPQVYLDEHQMGSTGPRIFVPPFQDPIGANIHPLIWRLTDLFGTEMAVRLQEAGRTGVIDNFAYDGYWPGGTMNTSWWKNVTGLLTEVASVRIATPIRIEENELSGGRKGLPEYRSQINFPEPWPGGWWRAAGHRRLRADRGPLAAGDGLALPQRHPAGHGAHGAGGGGRGERLGAVRLRAAGGATRPGDPRRPRGPAARARPRGPAHDGGFPGGRPRDPGRDVPGPDEPAVPRVRQGDAGAPAVPRGPRHGGRRDPAAVRTSPAGLSPC